MHKQLFNILKHFDSWSLSNIDRSINQFADVLSKLASSSVSCHTEPIYIKELATPSTKEESVMTISDTQDWRTPIIQYIKETLCEGSEVDKRRIAFKAKNYFLTDDNSSDGP